MIRGIPVLQHGSSLWQRMFLDGLVECINAQLHTLWETHRDPLFFWRDPKLSIGCIKQYIASYIPAIAKINVLVCHNLFEVLTTLKQLRNIIPNIGRILGNGTGNAFLSPLFSYIHSYCIPFYNLLVISKTLLPHIPMCRLFELFLIRAMSFLARSHKCVFVIYCYYRPEYTSIVHFW